MAQLNHEPSMEDILASIKRIIAEDGEAQARPARPIRREMEPVSVAAARIVEEPAETVTAEFEPVVEEAPPEIDAAPEIDVAVEEAAIEEGDPADVLELTSPLAEDATPPSAPTPEPPFKEPVSVMHRLMSDPAAQASRSAFAALAQLQVRAETGQENTLEGLVADLLQPMLREWLDRELPALVERLVSAEIGRISGRV